ncbi:MAG: zinc-ribbon domain-containing protein, partial [Alteromonas sp.]|nr:zinc-ribbon domain-containing protein [Alteromonas sp.]
MGKVDEQDYKVLLANLKAEAAQLRRQIDDLNEGKMVTNPAIEAEIERLVNQIPNETLNANDNHALLAEIEADIERLKRMVPGVEPACANCGNAYEVGDAFCADCGQSLDGAEHPHDESKCAQCGYVLRPDDTFCAKCGTKTSSAALIAELGLRI